MTSPLGVAIFSSSFYPHLGGVEELARQLAHENIRRGGRAAIFTNRWPKSLPDYESYEGIDVRRYVFRVPENNLKQMGGALLYGALTLRKVCCDIAAFAPQVLHVQCVSSNAYYAIQVRRKLRLPLVISLQGELTMDASGLFQRSTFARGLMKRALREADAITACSEQTLREGEKFYGAPFGDRGRVVYNGIRLADFEDARPFEHPRPYVLGIGRHVHQKGFDLLIRAFANLIRSGNSTHDLIIAGDGPERTALEELARHHLPAGRFRFTGAASRPQVAALFAGCDTFVLPSRHEPQGIVTLEAMAAGRPVVAARVGGVAELVIDGSTGLVFEPENIASLESVLRSVLSDTDLRRRLGAAGPLHAARYDWELISKQYREVYAAALARFRGTPQRDAVAI